MRHRTPKPPPDEHHPWPVRLWWAAEDLIPGFLPAERRFWRLAWQVRHPRAAWWLWRKWRNRPAPGDQVTDCRSEIHTVTGFGGDRDTLILDDGSHCSWMNCCDWPPTTTTR